MKLFNIAVFVLILALVAFIVYWYTIALDNVKTLTPDEVKNPVAVADAIGVSKAVGAEIVDEIKEAVKHHPAVSYAVQADTPKEAAPIVERQIKEDKAPVKLPPADKTIIVPTETKVDVYRINLRKDNGIGIYASTESAGLLVQHKNVIIFGGPKYDGGYDVGAAYMVRW
jgi:hypothetical protein